eukprot:CAMPEP_0113574874 /NCGR_PEP_ID=MMETSP0015_2-20120614/27379_1 /TAXON_ID=2838 /ORGANISM="Odontella" /LENGTH=897 /DNA_ID=CAMNT_0000478039 /DNA_START=287 /DNA_END=2981 /DNA_ORIENTATION=+ /assembly_acc=CAM_ASM_000160
MTDRSTINDAIESPTHTGESSNTAENRPASLDTSLRNDGASQRLFSDSHDDDRIAKRVDEARAFFVLIVAISIGSTWWAGLWFVLFSSGVALLCYLSTIPLKKKSDRSSEFSGTWRQFFLSRKAVLVIVYVVVWTYLFRAVRFLCASKDTDSNLEMLKNGIHQGKKNDPMPELVPIAKTPATTDVTSEMVSPKTAMDKEVRKDVKVSLDTAHDSSEDINSESERNQVKLSNSEAVEAELLLIVRNEDEGGPLQQDKQIIGDSVDCEGPRRDDMVPASLLKSEELKDEAPTAGMGDNNIAEEHATHQAENLEHTNAEDLNREDDEVVAGAKATEQEDKSPPPPPLGSTSQPGEDNMEDIDDEVPEEISGWHLESDSKDALSKAGINNGNVAEEGVKQQAETVINKIAEQFNEDDDGKGERVAEGIEQNQISPSTPAPPDNTSQPAGQNIKHVNDEGPEEISASHADSRENWNGDIEGAGVKNSNVAEEGVKQQAKNIVHDIAEQLKSEDDDGEGGRVAEAIEQQQNSPAPLDSISPPAGQNIENVDVSASHADGSEDLKDALSGAGTDNGNVAEEGVKQQAGTIIHTIGEQSKSEDDDGEGGRVADATEPNQISPSTPAPLDSTSQPAGQNIENIDGEGPEDVSASHADSREDWNGDIAGAENAKFAAETAQLSNEIVLESAEELKFETEQDVEATDQSQSLPSSSAPVDGTSQLEKQTQEDEQIDNEVPIGHNDTAARIESVEDSQDEVSGVSKGNDNVGLVSQHSEESSLSSDSADTGDHEVPTESRRRAPNALNNAWKNAWKMARRRIHNNGSSLIGPLSTRFDNCAGDDEVCSKLNSRRLQKRQWDKMMTDALVVAGTPKESIDRGGGWVGSTLQLSLVFTGTAPGLWNWNSAE